MNTNGRIIIVGNRALFESAFAEKMPVTTYDAAALRNTADILNDLANKIDTIGVALSPIAGSTIQEALENFDNAHPARRKSDRLPNNEVLY